MGKKTVTIINNETGQRAEFPIMEGSQGPAVFDIRSRRTRIVQDEHLAPAIHASCAVPLLFHPVWLEGRPCYDGGILDRHGLEPMAPGRLLYHHLASRSPWRRPGSVALAIPERQDMVALSIDRLPRVGPFHLERGARAYRQALDATRKALDRPISAVVRM